MQTKVVNKRNDAAHDVYVGRPTKWGNPFRADVDGTRDEVVEMYEEYLKLRPDLMAALGELKGKRIACWCAPLRCHADVLAEYADRA